MQAYPVPSARALLCYCVYNAAAPQLHAFQQPHMLPYERPHHILDSHMLPSRMLHPRPAICTSSSFNAAMQHAHAADTTGCLSESGMDKHTPLHQSPPPQQQHADSPRFALSATPSAGLTSVGVCTCAAPHPAATTPCNACPHQHERCNAAQAGKAASGMLPLLQLGRSPHCTLP